MGKILAVHPIVFSDPGMSNANMRMVELLVDLDAPANQDPQQELDDGEHIRVYTVPTGNLLQTLKLMCKNHEYEVDARLWSLAFGLSRNSSGLVQEANHLLQKWELTHSLAMLASMALTAGVVFSLCSLQRR